MVLLVLTYKQARGWRRLRAGLHFDFDSRLLSRSPHWKLIYSRVQKMPVQWKIYGCSNMSALHRQRIPWLTFMVTYFQTQNPIIGYCIFYSTLFLQSGQLLFHCNTLMVINWANCAQAYIWILDSRLLSRSPNWKLIYSRV